MNQELMLRAILKHPDERLRQVAATVEKFDDDIRNLISSMIHTMDCALGAGLAAPQIGVSKRVFVMLDQQQHRPIVFVNPQITARRGMQQTSEGCLSLPGITQQRQRAASVTVTALDRTGTRFELKTHGFSAAEKFLAACIQHEIDHLDGVLMIDG